MAFDRELAERVRDALPPDSTIEERLMFGGIAFLRRGSMFCGILNDDLMVRVGPDDYFAALKRSHVRPMDFTGRPMKGLVYVSRGGLRTRANLVRWIELGLTYVDTLPPKKSKRARRKKTRARRAESRHRLA